MMEEKFTTLTFRVYPSQILELKAAAERLGKKPRTLVRELVLSGIAKAA
jgi:hypothetical protein